MVRSGNHKDSGMSIVRFRKKQKEKWPEKVG